MRAGKEKGLGQPPARARAGCARPLGPPLGPPAPRRRSPSLSRLPVLCTFPKVAENAFSSGCWGLGSPPLPPSPASFRKAQEAEVRTRTLASCRCRFRSRLCHFPSVCPCASGLSSPASVSGLQYRPWCVLPPGDGQWHCAWDTVALDECGMGSDRHLESEVGGLKCLSEREALGFQCPGGRRPSEPRSSRGMWPGLSL